MEREKLDRLKNNDPNLIDVGFKQVFEDEKDVAELVEAIKSNTQTKSMGFKKNSMTEAGMISLVEGIAENKSLNSVGIYFNKVNDAVCTALTSGLSLNKTLTKLDLRNNDIGDEGAIAFANFLSPNSCPLLSLYLGKNRIGLIGATSLGTALETNTILVLLDLYGNCIHVDAVVSIAKSIASNTTIKELELGGNGIDERGPKSIGTAALEAIAERLKKNAKETKKEESCFVALQEGRCVCF